jgi:hypothetical protein
MTEVEEKQLREKAKGLGVKSWHVKSIEKLEAEVKEIEDAQTPPEAPEVPAEEPEAPEVVAESTPEPIDPSNPDAQGLAERQAKASTEARLKKLEEALAIQLEENGRLREEIATKDTTPTVGVPEKPNPNTMVYYKDGVDKKGNDIIAHKQVSFAEAKMLLETDEYKKSPAEFKSEE